MIKTSLSSDDLPPAEKTSTDWVLSRQLEGALNQIFHQACQNLEVPDRKCSLLTLLSECEWYITTQASLTTLVINCQTLATSWGILENIVAIAQLLEELAIGKICVCPPSDKGTPLEVRVDEIAIYREERHYHNNLFSDDREKLVVRLRRQQSADSRFHMSMTTK